MVDRPSTDESEEKRTHFCHEPMCSSSNLPHRARWEQLTRLALLIVVDWKRSFPFGKSAIRNSFVYPPRIIRPFLVIIWTKEQFAGQAEDWLHKKPNQQWTRSVKATDRRSQWRPLSADSDHGVYLRLSLYTSIQ